MQAKNKWKVQIYLGKELYQEIEKLANELEMPMATLLRLCIVESDIKSLCKPALEFVKAVKGGLEECLKEQEPGHSQ